MPNSTHKPASDAEAEIWNAIVSFEKILEAIPGDRVSLETLADAYEKVGDHSRAKEYIIRLVNALLEEGDEDGARDVVHRLREMDQNDEDIKAIINRIETIKPKKVMALVLDGTDEGALKKPFNIAAEISFAWNLLQAGKLKQEEYASVVHDLSENSTKANLEVPVSVLHVLHDRTFAGMNDVMVHAALSNGTPIISLSSFELQIKVCSLIPLDFMVRRGCIIFEQMGNDLLVGVLNPFDPQLPEDLEEITGKVCHRFLSNPPEFDGTLTKIRKALADAAK